jgi:hypothetical protein
VETGWDQLSPEVQQRIIDCGARNWRRLHDKVPGYQQIWRPIRPVIMTSGQLADLHAVSDRIGELILQSCLRRARTAGELRRALGVPDGRIKLLDEAEPLSAQLLVSTRPDVLISGGVPKYVEFNIDGALGGAFDTDTLTRNAAEVYRDEGIAELAGLYPTPSAVDGRFRALSAWLGDAADRRLVMVMDWKPGHGGPADPSDFLKFLAPVSERARAFGMELVPYWLHWLKVDERQRLLVDGVPFTNVFRMFVPDTPPPSDGLDALTAALRAGNVRCFTSSAAWLLANKMTLAWLWEDLAEWSEADQQLVRAHIPHTSRVTAESAGQLIADQQGLVLKPCDGSAGRGVQIGRDETAEAWRAGVQAAVADGGFLVQELIESDLLTMQFVRMATGEVVHAAVPACFGPYLYGHQQCGSLVRMGFPEGGAVMNVDRGALMDGFALVD